jgi:hypothetical protein
MEIIASNGRTLAYVIRASWLPEKTTFVTPPDYKQQVGFVVGAGGSEIRRHVHRPLQRTIVGTSEVLVVRRGRCEVDFYDDDRQPVATRELNEGDLLLLVAGGHGFRMLDDTVLLEVKQGPYTGVEDKDHF